MKIKSLGIKNYRTLQQIDLEFSNSYSAICGANDSGKTNVVRAIRALVKEDDSDFPFFEEQPVSLRNDYPKWLDTENLKREIVIQIAIVLDKERDAGFYQFAIKQLEVGTQEQQLELSILVTYKANAQTHIRVTLLGKDYTDVNAQEILKKLQSSRGILFHNSTQSDPRFAFPRGGSAGGYIREITGQHETLITSMKKTLNKGLAKISKAEQTGFEDLLGRLQTKYKVSLTVPTFDFGFLPYAISLGQKTFEVPLGDWGSGTRNRTLILLALFRAKQIAESEASASKVTPVIIVEEPESFLHPSAQAELGRILHDLSKEFDVQVIVTTHSPYLLSMDTPSSNILLGRRIEKKQLKETERVNTSGEEWMAPFVHSLGLNTEEFKPWKTLLFSPSDAVLLLEGETDKEYFTLLKDAAHGANQLRFSGEIIAYDGKDNLQNSVLLRFIKNRYRALFVTFDLDAAESLVKALNGLQLEKGKHYLAVGLDAPGKKNIEGLLPDSVTNAVFGSNAALVQQATNGSKDERKSARNKLKRLLLDEFKKTAKPGAEYYGNFYPLVKTINKAAVCG